jgi:hypothetical protein
MQLIEHASFQKGHVMMHYAPDLNGVERLSACYLLRRSKMSFSHHAHEGLPVVFNGKITRNSTSTRSKTTFGEQATHVRHHCGIAAQHDARAGRLKRNPYALFEFASGQ